MENNCQLELAGVTFHNHKQARWEGFPSNLKLALKSSPEVTTVLFCQLSQSLCDLKKMRFRTGFPQLCLIFGFLGSVLPLYTAMCVFQKKSTIPLLRPGWRQVAVHVYALIIIIV